MKTDTMVDNNLEKRQYLSTAELLDMMRISRPTLYKLLKHEKDFPKPIFLGKRKMIFNLKSIKNWLKERGDE